MWVLEILGMGAGQMPPPRSYEEIEAAVHDRDAEHIQRLHRVEASLLALTAEAGLEDLRRRLHEQISHD